MNAVAPHTVTFGLATIYIDPVECYVRTTFVDGAYCEARPNDSEEDRARAASLGYGSVEEMTIAHDLTHSFYAWKCGVLYSPTLWNVAHGITDDELAGREEAAILALQRFFNDPAAHRFPRGWRDEFRALLEG